MIAGIGTDIVATKRIQHVWQHFGKRFAEKILSIKELSEFSASHYPIPFLAKRFAAKEALVKALGTGFRNGITFPQIEIIHDIHGQPAFKLSGVIQNYFEMRNIHSLHLSISDEKEYVLAFVICEI